MAESQPSHEPEVSKEKVGFSPHITLQARMAMGEIYLDPNKKHTTTIEPESFKIHSEVDARINAGSHMERGAQTKTVDEWSQAMEEHMKQSSDFFKNSEKGKTYAQVLEKVLGKKVDGMTAAQAKEVYEMYGNPEDGATAYADRVADLIKNKEIDAGSLDAAEWFANIFGEKTSEILAQRIGLQNALNNPAGPKLLADEASKPKDGDTVFNSPTPREKELLMFLHNAKSTDPSHVEEPDTSGTTTNGGDGHGKSGAESDGKERSTIEELTNNVIKPQKIADLFKDWNTDAESVELDGQVKERWFVAEPPSTIGVLSEDEVRGITRESMKEYYVQNTGPGAKLNLDAFPYWEVIQKDEGTAGTFKYLSHIFALSNATAATPEKQAILFQDIADISIQAHQHDPEVNKKWLKAQKDAHNGYSFDVIKEEDKHLREQDSSGRLKRLTPLNAEGELDETVFSQQLEQVKQHISAGEVSLSDLQFIDRLSQALDMQKVIDLIRSKSGGVDHGTGTATAMGGHEQTPPAGAGGHDGNTGGDAGGVPAENDPHVEHGGGTPGAAAAASPGEEEMHHKRDGLFTRMGKYFRRSK